MSRRHPPALDATPVIDTRRSPQARLQLVPISRLQLSDPFLEPRRRLGREVTLPGQYRLLEETNRLRNFRRIADRTGEPFDGLYFNDSDVYKWLEAAAWTLADGPHAELEGMVAEVARIIEGAQDDNGYLNTYYTLQHEDERWTNLKDRHEMYCAGHFIQAAVAHWRATGSAQLLNVARRLADHIDSLFGPASQGKREASDGHEEIEMALVELYRVTHEARYLRLAEFLVDVRGHGKVGAEENHRSYYQDHRPVREMPGVVGHAVRMVYLTCGATDTYLENGDPALLRANERLWTHMTTRQMYVSGGLGARYEGEAFGEDFELPNARAYTETCAAIGSVMWNARLHAATADAKYADLLEHTLYNAVLPGWSMDGETYFYQNPLADEGNHRRRAWFGCACCPPNVARLMASLPGYVYSQNPAGDVWVNLYAQGDANLKVGSQEVALVQRTRYPWDGEITFTVGTAACFTLHLRVPAWAQGATLHLNGEMQPAATPGGYAALGGAWQPGDQVTLSLPMPVRRVRSHPRVLENTGRVALMRGPLLYALEGVDHPGVPLDEVVLPPTATIVARDEPGLLGGVTVLEAPALRVPLPDLDGPLYLAGSAPHVPSGTPTTLSAVPYHVWANRAPGQLRVWVREG